jgi:hypothetical protein
MSDQPKYAPGQGVWVRGMVIGACESNVNVSFHNEDYYASMPPADVRPAAPEPDAEIALLRARLHTILLSIEGGSRNPEVTKRLAELENTSDQARQYVQNAQAREHENAALRSRIERLEGALRAITKVAQDWHDFHHGDSIVQCDEICEALPAARAALGEETP